ncbi:Sec-independent protein translocase protein TatB [Alsobacter soli]|uniref:Sec-independent protein translocase protein TatB n=1 Tax=Alsobacter soli TaxID=2109933 RepID=UPI001AECFF5C|nr:Sec-independent protein translocase protein TatB [Alsobacter soli]
MLDIGWGEFVVIGVVALVVIGPKELPGVLRTVGRTVGKVKRLAGEFQGQFQDAMREMELEEARKTVEGLNNEVSSTLNTGFNPIQTIRDEIKSATETPATAAEPLPETKIDIPEPPPVPDLTPEQIQAAFAPVVPDPEPSGTAEPIEAAAPEAAPEAEVKPKPKRVRKKAAAAEPPPEEPSAADRDLFAPVAAVATAPVAPEAVEAAEAPAAKPKRRTARKKTTTEDEGSAG